VRFVNAAKLQCGKVGLGKAAGMKDAENDGGRVEETQALKLTKLSGVWKRQEQLLGLK
jgi:hypothetical protein